MCTFYTNLQKPAYLVNFGQPPVPAKIICENLNWPKQRSKWPQIKKRTPKTEDPISVQSIEMAQVTTPACG